MPGKRPSLVLVFIVILAIGTAWGSNINQTPRRFASFSNQYVLPAAVDFSAPMGFPSSPDNWLGGTGNWSNGADWSAGLPGSANDVFINTGSDNVTLDTSFSINSLTLGGSRGSSQLTADGNPYTLTIVGALTINQSGNLYLSNDNMTVGASSVNLGMVDLENGTTVQISGDFDNSGFIGLGQNVNSFSNNLNVSGTLTNSGTLSIGSYSGLYYGEGSVTASGINNTGNITIAGPATLQVNGNALNSGEISLMLGPSVLSVTGNFLNYGTLGTGGGDETCCPSISISGTLTNSSGASVRLGEDGGVTHVGALVNQGQFGLSSGFLSNAMFTASGNAVNSGPITLGGGLGAEEFQVGGTLTNNTGAQLDLTTSLASASAGNLINNGSIVMQGGNGVALQVSGNIQNSGTISESGYNTTIQGTALTNSGSITLSDLAILRINGDVNNSGTISTSPEAQNSDTINITGKLTNTTGANFSLGANQDVANISFITNAGSVYLASGTSLNVTGGARSSANTLPGFLNTGIVDISSGATISSPLSFTQTSGQTTVDGTLRISSRGLIDFAGGSVYGNQGTLQGTVLSNGAINIGDAPMLVGQLAIMGNYTQLANGSLTFDIAGPASGQYDQFNVSGNAHLNGLMTVDLLHGYVPQIGNIFDIMNFASSSGTFSSVVGLPINGQEHFVLEYNPTNLTLDVESGQILGPTVTGHGAFSANDPFIPSGVQTGDGYSLTASDTNGPAGSTPEPGTILLFGSGVAGLAGLLRDKRSS